MRLVTNKEKLIKLASKPTFVSCKIFNKNLVAVHEIKESLSLNRPAYVGMSILDLSKTLMYGTNAKLLFTDTTDSLRNEIETEDSYQDFWNDKEKVDNSDYREDSKFYEIRKLSVK